MAAPTVHGYIPRPFAGKVAHFLAGDAPVSSRVLEVARLGWRDFARGGFEHHYVRGEHDFMFLESHAPELAGRMLDMFRCTLNDLSAPAASLTARNVTRAFAAKSDRGG